MEFVLGAVSASAAAVFSNPLDVLKVKAQLQGELRARGRYTLLYRNMFHTAYRLASEEGVWALQRGLVPALLFHATLSGTRFGLFQLMEDAGLTRRQDGAVSLPRTMAAAAAAGAAGVTLGSPLYKVKVQLQSHAAAQVAALDGVVLGEQHGHRGVLDAFRTLARGGGGLRGLWAGSSGVVASVTVGSCAQLSTFSTCKEFIERHQLFEEDAVWKKAFASSMVVGVVAALCTAPLDNVSTRLFNQRRDGSGRGQTYGGVLDCVRRTLRCEGLRGLYKGLLPVYARTAPHSTLNLVFWDKLKELQRAAPAEEGEGLA